jgi:hypothetical protein
VDWSTGRVSVPTTASAGTYFLSVKYSASSLVGQPVTAPYPTAKYGFSTVQNGDALVHSYDSVLVAPK